MLNNILEYLKHPVTCTLDRLEQENLKSSGLKSLIISALISLISVIATYISILSRYSKDSWYGNYYSEAQLRKMKSQAIENAELFTNFLKSAIFIFIIIAAVALILFIIAKILKSSIEYKDILCIINRILIVSIIGIVLSLLVGKIYNPLGVIMLYATSIFTSLTFMNAYRDALYIEDVDKLVVVSTIVFVVVMVLISLALSSILSNLFSSII